jgi:hypothetical protein
LARITWLLLLASPTLASAAWGQAPERARRKSRGARAAQTAPAPAVAAAPAAPVPPLAGPDRPFVAIRVECNDGLPSELCDVVREAATSAAARNYRVVDPAKVEAVLNKEPALRGCRREDCRVAITDQLGAERLIDVNIQTPQRGRGFVGTVALYDPVAKGISGDTEIPPTRRDESHVRRAIYEAVEYVIGAQRLTATLRLNIQPEGARVKIDGNDRGTVREVKLFLGPHTVRVERVGYIPVERTVNVTPAGATLEIRLQQQPISVKLEWSPPEARLLVDGEPVEARGSAVLDLLEGKRRVQVLAPAGSEYDSLDFDLLVKPGMDVVRKHLPRKGQLRIQSPRGYAVRVDNRLVDPGKVTGQVQETVVSTKPGPHQVSAVSWRGLTLSTAVQTFSGGQADAVLRPPSLVPGLLLGVAGLVGIAGGATMVALHGQCSRPNCTYMYDFSWQTDAPSQQPPTAGILALSLGGAALSAGSIWFGYNAANHPAFHKEEGARAAARSRLRARIAPAFSSSGGGLVVQGGF